MKILLLTFFFSASLWAQVPAPIAPPYPTEGSEVVPVEVKDESPAEQVIEAEKPLAIPESKIEEKVRITSRDHREDSRGTVMVGYQLLTTWLPGKKTASYTHIFNEKWSLEGEYAWSSIDDPIVGVDLASLKEKRSTLQARRYVGNSFNFSFGAVYNQFSAHVGSDTLDNFGQKISQSFSAENMGITGGFGNRWQWGSGFTLGIDWMRINIPLFETRVRDDILKDISGSNEKSDVKKVIRTFNHIPTFVLFGLNIGYTF